MGRGKHSADQDYSYETKFNKEFDYEDDNDSRKKIVIVVIVIIAVLVVAGIAIYKVFFEKTNEQVEEPKQVVQEEKMISNIEGYNVLGQIVIDDLDVKQYILDSTEDKALENGVIKLYGGTLNNYGNFCIAGHDYDNIFKRLAELSVGDTFTIIDRDLEETEYEIKQIYSVEPNDLTCLMQDENKVEITLITCENGSTTRLIVKAEEKNQDTSYTNSLSNSTTQNIVNEISEENV